VREGFSPDNNSTNSPLKLAPTIPNERDDEGGIIEAFFGFREIIKIEFHRSGVHPSLCSLYLSSNNG